MPRASGLLFAYLNEQRNLINYRHASCRDYTSAGDGHSAQPTTRATQYLRISSELFVFGKSREIFISELTASAAEASLLNVIVKGGGLFPKMAAKMGKFLDKSYN